MKKREMMDFFFEHGDQSSTDAINQDWLRAIPNLLNRTEIHIEHFNIGTAIKQQRETQVSTGAIKQQRQTFQ